MKFCGSCGAPLEDGTRFCPSCGAPQSAGPGGYNSGTGTSSGREPEKGIGDKIGEFAGSTARKISDTASSMKDAYNDRMADLSQKKVQLSDGEVPVREYEVSRVFIPRVPGKLLITNKRILFYSQSL
ncbi:MAG: zinc ribbon domain-containing protein, partial [Lachnospiraceae bacterium]|nr:zinc ribbon domain-containing protein [Lachnospiraceae bacterium]